MLELIRAIDNLLNNARGTFEIVEVPRADFEALRAARADFSTALLLNPESSEAL